MASSGQDRAATERSSRGGAGVTEGGESGSRLNCAAHVYARLLLKRVFEMFTEVAQLGAAIFGGGETQLDV